LPRVDVVVAAVVGVVAVVVVELQSYVNPSVQPLGALQAPKKYLLVPPCLQQLLAPAAKVRPPGSPCPSRLRWGS